jgi:hypothetical protein
MRPNRFDLLLCVAPPSWRNKRLARRVAVRADKMDVETSRSELRASFTDNQSGASFRTPSQQPVTSSDDLIRRTVEAQLKHCGKEMWLVGIPTLHSRRPSQHLQTSEAGQPPPPHEDLRLSIAVLECRSEATLHFSAVTNEASLRAHFTFRTTLNARPKITPRLGQVLKTAISYCLPPLASYPPVDVLILEKTSPRVISCPPIR